MTIGEPGPQHTQSLPKNEAEAVGFCSAQDDGVQAWLISTVDTLQKGAGFRRAVHQNLNPDTARPEAVPFPSSAGCGCV